MLPSRDNTMTYPIHLTDANLELLGTFDAIDKYNPSLPKSMREWFVCNSRL